MSTDRSSYGYGEFPLLNRNSIEDSDTSVSETVIKSAGGLGLYGVANRVASSSELTPRAESADTSQRAIEGAFLAAKAMHARGKFTPEYAIGLVSALASCDVVIDPEHLHQAVNGISNPLH